MQKKLLLISAVSICFIAVWTGLHLQRDAIPPGHSPVPASAQSVPVPTIQTTPANASKAGPKPITNLEAAYVVAHPNANPVMMKSSEPVPGAAASIPLADDFFEAMLDKDRQSVRFALPGGEFAVGNVELIRREDNGSIAAIQGHLTQPHPGFYYFNRQSMPGVAGAFFGHVLFDGVDLAYSAEPEGVNGAPMLVPRKRQQIVCDNMPDLPLVRAEANPQNAPQSYPDNNPVPGSQHGIISLQSLPGAPAVIFLDYEGGPGPWEGWSYGAMQPANISTAQIKEAWEGVAEDYQEFNINITTDRKVFEAAPHNSRQRVMITPTFPGAGVAYLGSFNSTGEEVCWSGYTTGKGSIEVISHESGHTLRLSHDGRDGGEYYSGHGNDPVGWTPIMGAGYYKQLSQFSKGEYPNPTNTEDDLAIITNNNNAVDYRADDYGDGVTGSGYLEVFPDNSVKSEGIIETSPDVDAFRFTSKGGPVVFDVRTINRFPNMDILAELYNSTNVVVASNNPDADIQANISTTLVAGDYTLRVSGVGRGSVAGDGYSDYGTLGSYLITGTAINTVTPDRFTIAENSPVNTAVGTVAPRSSHGASTLTYAISSGNESGAFSINSSTGAISVASSAPLDFETLSTRWDDPATLPIFVTIADSGNPVLNETVRVVVTVTDVNEAPIIAGATRTMFSRTRVGTEVLTVFASDPDRYDFPTLSIISDPSGSFEIDRDTGLLTVSAAPVVTTATTYNLTVRATDQRTPARTADATVQITVLPLAGTSRPGAIPRTFYEGIGGNNVSDLTSNAKFPNSPDSEQGLPKFDGGTHGDSYGSTMTGYLIVPATGAYTFYIASDDASEFRLSTDSNPTTATVRASAASATDSHNYDRFTSQRSLPITLTAGTLYYIEARQKEGGGGDYVSVAWEGPGIAVREEIPGLYLAPLVTNRAPTLASATFAARRNANTGTTVGKAIVTDFNGSDTHTFTITGGSGTALFGIRAETGGIFVKDSAALAAQVGSIVTLDVTATDSGSPSMAGSATFTINLADSGTINFTGLAQQIFRNYFGGDINGISSIERYPYKPTYTNNLSSFDSPDQGIDDYASRTRGYVIPSITGTYRFYIASDDHSSFRLSNGESPNNATQISSVNGATGRYAWTQQGGQTSAPQALVAGQRYYFEALHREGGGGDFVAVAWTGPNNLTPTVIPGSALQPFDINVAPIFDSPNYALSTVVGAASGSRLGDVRALDPEGDSVTYSIVSGNGAGKVTLNAGTGRVAVATGAQFFPGETLTLTVSAQDNGIGGSYPLALGTATVTIQVAGFELQTIARKGMYDNTTLGALNPANLANGDSYTLQSNSGSGIFGFTPATGRVFVSSSSALSAATQSVYTMSITSGSSGGYTVTIKVYAADAVAFTGISKQIFLNFNGNVTSLPSHPNYPYFPDYTKIIPSLDAGSEGLDTFGTRLRAFVVPPTTGEYRFYISSDDSSQLFLGTSDNPNSASQIANVPGFVDPRGFNKYPGQTSAPVSLVGGQRYYLEARHQDGYGGDDLVVAWTGPGIASPTTVPGSAVQPFNINAAPIFTGAPYTFSVASDAPAGTVIGTPSAADPEGEALRYAILSGNSSGAFAINQLTGQLTVANSAALPGGSVVTITVGTQDDGLGRIYPLASASTIINIAVNIGINTTLAARRDSYTGHRIGTLDVSAYGQPQGFTVTDGTGTGLFSVNAVTGQISVISATALVAATAPSYTLIAITTVNGGAKITVTVTINIIAADVINLAGIVRQVFTGYTGALAALPSNPRYPHRPQISRGLTSFDAGSLGIEKFASRVRAYVVPPTTGPYRFYISSDDDSTLLLSTNDSPANATAVASVATPVQPRSYTAQLSQVSIPVNLTAGQRYYIEALHRQDVGTDDLAVAWTTPASPILPAVIPGSALRAFDFNTAPAFTASPYEFTATPGFIAGTPVGNVLANDPEGDEPTYAIIGGNPTGNFAIDPVSGLIGVANPSGLTAGQNVTLIVSAQDAGVMGAYPLKFTSVNVKINIVPSGLRDLVWKGDGTRNAWDLLTTRNWLDSTSLPTVFENGDRVVFNDSGSNVKPAFLGGVRTPATVSFEANQDYTLGGGPIAGSTSLRKSGTGTVTLSSPHTYTSGTTISAGRLLLGGLAHRWSFNGDLTDSIGGRSATLVDVGSNNAVLTPTAVEYAGGDRNNSDYVDLGSDLLPNVEQPVVIELWATHLSVKYWSRIFDFGSGGAENLFMGWTIETNLQNDRVSWTDQAASDFVDGTNSPYTLGTRFHIVMTITPGAGTGGKTLVTWYSAPSSAPSLGAVRGSFSTANRLSDLNTTNAWLGRSQFNDETANASYDELRIWHRPLSSADLQTLHAAGADANLNAIVLSPGSDTASQLPVLPIAGAVRLTGPGAILDTQSGMNQLVSSLTGVAGTSVRLTAGSLTVGSDGTSTEFAGATSGAGSLTKTGAGTLILSGSNRHTGSTTVRGGTLVVNGDSSAATGLITVATGTSLIGGGILGGPVSLESGGNLAPGNPVGTLSTGSSTWSGAASYDWEIKDATSPSGTDHLNISGTLQLVASSNSPFTVRIHALGSGANPSIPDNFHSSTSYSWKLVTTTGGITGFDPAVIHLEGSEFAPPSAFTVSLSPNGQDLLLNYSPTSGYDFWASLRFSPSELADPLLSGNLADFDGDGITNLEEYAYGGDPKTADRNILPLVQISGDYLVTTFTRLLDRTDINYAVQATPDLTNLETVARSLLGAATLALNGGDVTATPDPADANRETVKARDHTKIDASTHRFMRVEVSRP